MGIATIDKEYKNKIEKLNQEIEELKEINLDQKKAINDKDDVISKTQDDVKEMGSAILKLQKEAIDRKNKMYSINHILFKVQGDNVSKLKYNKISKKFVVFIEKINHIFYYDESGNNKSEQKYIVIKDISINNNSIQKQMNKPWFLIIGEKRCALFAAESKQTRDQWVNFIKKSLATNQSNDTPGNTNQEETKKDE